MLELWCCGQDLRGCKGGFLAHQLCWQQMRSSACAVVHDAEDEEEDAEVKLEVDPGVAGGGAHDAGGGGDAKVEAKEEEEYYDDEGADHDREDDEE